ncbi:tetratricopeptide repeat protein [Aquicoccus sp. SCR17]|nr:tetratricopeptide repeat protein [Carideicomes alvinocaridis]
MQTDVEIGVEKPPPDTEDAALSIRLVGPLCVLRQGCPVVLPKSRKVRALIAYLALAERPVGRSRLCELLGNTASDPRGELRGYLTSMRSVLDRPDRPRVIAKDDMVSLDLADAEIDAVQMERAVRKGLDRVDTDDLIRLADHCTGDFVEGLCLGRSPDLGTWLASQREHCRNTQAAILEHLIRRLPPGDTQSIRLAQKWVGIEPDDKRAHDALRDCSRAARATVRTVAAARRPGGALGTAAHEAEAETRAAGADRTPPARPGISVAIMPFQDDRAPANHAGLGSGFTRDIITRLARMRSITVIAQGSVFALTESGTDPAAAARALNVDYVATGRILRHRDRVLIGVELSDAWSSGILWSESYALPKDLPETETFELLDLVGDKLVATLHNQIEFAEMKRAVLRPPNSVDAWDCYHRGLWHMYRFTRAENDRAQLRFRQAVEADPTFARAHAGLSFTHWQSAFQCWNDNLQEMDLARTAAEKSLMADALDPSAHLAMGRALWLSGEQTTAIGELEQAVSLSPGFAAAHYALAFVQAQSGDPGSAIRASDRSRALSPYDPLLFGMLGSKAIAYVRLDRFSEAADLAIQAAKRPNAHLLIKPIAALSLALAGRIEEARAIGAEIRTSRPGYTVDTFLSSYKFAADAEARFRSVAGMIGFD